MEVLSFDDIRDEFLARISRIVWCTAATIDRKGRPRTRILHPIWEGSTGWIATGRHSHKEKHLAANPYMSLGYWDQAHQQVHVDCRAEWIDDASEKARIWNAYKETPPPLGYDPGIIWKGPDDPGYGVLKLTPWRIEMWSVQEMFAGSRPTIWRP